MLFNFDVDVYTFQMIVIEKGTYYLGMWSFEYGPPLSRAQSGDFMLCIWRKMDDPRNWTSRYRFREHLDDKAFESKDTKHWYEMVIRDSDENEVLEKMGDFVNILAAAFNLKPDFFEIKGDDEKFLELLKTNPPAWMHLQQTDAC